MPWFVVGSMGGYFKTGRLLRFPRLKPAWLRKSDDYGIVHSAGLGRSNNDLFVSLANAMGIDVSTFGNPAVCAGPIKEMRG